jgi:hypothetical protein
MGFGRNPYVSKAQAAEQKAAEAPDDAARTRAHREAAHEWDRARERESPGKRRQEYERNAARNRELADDGAPATAADPGEDDESKGHAPPPIDPKQMN